MEVFYELQDVQVWLDPSRPAALIGVCGVVDATEAAQFQASDRAAGTWSHVVAQGDEKMLLLALRGERGSGITDLRFVAAPSEGVLEALRLAASAQAMVFTALFTDQAALDEAMSQLAANPNEAPFNRLASKAIFFSTCRVEPGTIAQFTS